MEEEKKEKGFVIKDRRLFDESGSVRNEEAMKAEEKKPDTVQEETKTPPEAEMAPETDQSSLAEVNLSSFILSLSTTAMFHFGDFPDPQTNEARRNLPAAKQTIDLLSILKAKTEGNLNEDEKQLLDGALFELRMRFVKEISLK